MMDDDFTLETVIHVAIRRALVHAHGNRQQAAKLLGIGRSTLYRYISHYGIQDLHDPRTPAVPAAAQL